MHEHLYNRDMSHIAIAGRARNKLIVFPLCRFAPSSDWPLTKWPVRRCGISSMNESLTEGLHALQRKLCSGLSSAIGYQTFCARCVNRASSRQLETAVLRNVNHSVRPTTGKVNCGTKRGGSACGKHLLHSEVCKELRLKDICSPKLLHRV